MNYFFKNRLLMFVTSQWVLLMIFQFRNLIKMVYESGALNADVLIRYSQTHQAEFVVNVVVLIGMVLIALLFSASKETKL